MKKLFTLYLIITSFTITAQTDYSGSWEDFYSYNNVKDFTKVDNVIYALTDNAVFTYDILTNEINKISSIQGLSGEPTTAIYYHKESKRLVIGYENGLVEIVDEDGSIYISSDIINFNQSGEKSINHISEFNNKLYLSTPFAIVVYDIEKLEFGDTYFIGNNSSSIKINETIVVNNVIYAVTEDGIFKADVSSNLLIDYNNWQQLFATRNFKGIAFLNDLFVFEDTKLFKFNGTTVEEVRDFSEEIKAIKASNLNLTISLDKSAVIIGSSMNEVGVFSANTDFDFSLNNTLFEDNTAYLATKKFGILQATIAQTNTYLEIHPEGPLSNDVFSIAADKSHLWVVYGGYSPTYSLNLNKQGFSHFNGQEWSNTKHSISTPFTDLTSVTIDPENINRVFISSYGSSSDLNSFATGGLFEIENNEVKTFYNYSNSSIEDTNLNANVVRSRVGETAFDNQGNLWVTNIEAVSELKKFSANNQWSDINLASLTNDKVAIGLTEVIVDKANSVWIGTRRNGVYVYNETGNRKRALTGTTNLGNLPDLNVRTVAVDRSNRIWLGTKSGLVVYSNAANVFDDTALNAKPVLINVDENGFGERLLGDQTINAISVDGGDNKWFGTDSGGVLYTDPNGTETISIFSKKNSPLPSNRILKIRVDNTTGKVYFATDKGIVAYNSKVAPFGDVIGAVYAYPNPVLSHQETVTIDGRNGTHLPRGTNVKILDVGGQLVYETNVVEGQELQGGKVVWNKKNLAGNKVASGIYIVLLSNDDASESSVTKIAIVN